MVRVPPREMAPDPELPAKVMAELASSTLSICPLGRATVPAETVKPLATVTDPVKEAAEEMVAVRMF